MHSPKWRSILKDFQLHEIYSLIGHLYMAIIICLHRKLFSFLFFVEECAVNANAYHQSRDLFSGSNKMIKFSSVKLTHQQ